MCECYKNRIELISKHHAICRAAVWNRLTTLLPLGAVIFLVVLVFPHPACTEEALIPAKTLTPPATVEREELVRGEERRPLNVYTGVRTVLRYTARGLVFSDQSAFQPWVELDVPVLRPRNEPNPLDTLAVFVGTWSNVNLFGSDDGQGAYRSDGCVERLV